MSTTPVPDKKTFTKGEGIPALIVVVIFCLVAWHAITSVPKSNTSVPVATQPASVQHKITVKQEAVKEVDGKYRYFFVIKNEDTTPFTGEVNIQLINGKGEDVYDDTFTTAQAMQPGDSTSQYIEVHTGPSSVDGEYGVSSFKYTIKGI